VATNILAVNNLSRRFGSKDALHDVPFQASEGRVYGLVGANGAGKTTLLKHPGLSLGAAACVEIASADLSIAGRYTLAVCKR